KPLAAKNKPEQTGKGKARAKEKGVQAPTTIDSNAVITNAKGNPDITKKPRTGAAKEPHDNNTILVKPYNKPTHAKETTNPTIAKNLQTHNKVDMVDSRHQVNQSRAEATKVENQISRPSRAAAALAKQRLQDQLKDIDDSQENRLDVQSAQISN